MARYKKPVGIYWLQAGPVIAVDKLGKRNALTTIGLYRLPSLIGAIGAVLLTYWVALAFVSRRAAVLAGLMMASAILLGVEARLAKTDAMLLATILAAMGTMARIYLGEHRIKPGLAGWTLPAVFWTALAGGMLIKGPLILLFVGLTIATLLIADRAWRWLLLLRPLQGIVWLAVLVAPWFVTILSRSGDAFVAELVGQDFAEDFRRAGEPWISARSLLPSILGDVLARGDAGRQAAPAVWASRREKGARFLLAWLVPSWIVFELVMTKLPHYVLPLYPAIAILIAGISIRIGSARKNWMMWGAAWWFVVPVVMVIGMIAGLVMFGRQLGVLAWPFAAGALVLGLLAWRLFDADGAERSLLRAIAASILMSIALFGVVLPAYPALFPSVPLSRYMRAVGCENPVAAAAGFHEPSLVYLAGTSTRLLDGTGAADFLRPGGCRFAFVEARHERGFLRRADAIGLRYFPGPRIEGYNISTGRSVSIAIYRRGTHEAMSALKSRLRAVASECGGAVTLFFGRRRLCGRRPAWPPHGGLAIGALVAILIVAVAVAVLDARSVAGARALPAALVWPFRHITDLGLSGWFLFPTAFLLLAVAAADSAGTAEVLAQCACGYLGAIGFIFMAVAVPGLFVAILKRLIGRARPFVAGEEPGPRSFSSGGPITPAFLPATPPRRSPLPLRSARCGRGAPVMWVYAVADRGQPGSGHGASPERRHRRGDCRRHRRAAGAQLVCRRGGSASR